VTSSTTIGITSGPPELTTKAEQSVSRTSSLGASIMRQTYSQLTESVTSTCTAVCPLGDNENVYVFQWANKLKTKADDELTMLTCHFACRYSNEYPDYTPFNRP